MKETYDKECYEGKVFLHNFKGFSTRKLQLIRVYAVILREWPSTITMIGEEYESLFNLSEEELKKEMLEQIEKM